MKKITLLFCVGFLFVSGILVAQTSASTAASELESTDNRAENIVITLVKDIERLSDSTHKHQHEAHKSSYKLVYFNLDIVSKYPAGTTPGMKTIMLKMIDSQGREDFDPVAGGGYFMMGGKESPYTLKQTFQYDGKKQHVEAFYNNKKRFSKGLHLIEIYMDGKKIGEEHFVIK